MNTASVHAGRLERRVRLVGNETMPGDSWILLFLSIRCNTRSIDIAPYRVSAMVATSLVISISGMPSSRRMRRRRRRIVRE